VVPTAVETAASPLLPPFLSRLSFLPLLRFILSSAAALVAASKTDPSRVSFSTATSNRLPNHEYRLLLAVLTPPGAVRPEHSRLHHLLEFAVARTSSDVASALKDSVDSPASPRSP
jgi:hypothetical protein